MKGTPIRLAHPAILAAATALGESPATCTLPAIGARSVPMFRRRFALAAVHLVFSAFVLGFASNAWAGDITYNIVDYPVNEANQQAAGTDTISGTIITDGTVGDWDGVNHVVGGTLNFDSPVPGPPGSAADGDYSFALSGPATYGAGGLLEATATELLVPSGDWISVLSNPPGTPNPAPTYIELSYSRNSGPDAFEGQVWSDGNGYAYASFSAIDPTATPGSIAANDPWIIATVPEPSTLVLAALAGIGLLFAARRRSVCRESVGP